MQSSLATSFNPSDYEFLIKSLTQDSLQGKSQSLKRLNTLVATDKKQFSSYAKRIVVLMQQLLLQPREDINLLASTLALQIINMNPREIQYYIRTKLLKNLIKNLGDSKPQIRKTSHYCLLAYVKAYRSFDDLISNYIMEGLYSDSWQLKQKCINSFQSILIMESKFLNWASSDFKRWFELLVDRLTDESPYVQKAAEQCLISLCKLDNVRGFSKRISQDYLALLRGFLETQKMNGTIQEIKIDPEVVKVVHTPEVVEGKTLSSAGQSLLSFQRPRAEEASRGFLMGKEREHEVVVVGAKGRDRYMEEKPKQSPIIYNRKIEPQRLQQKIIQPQKPIQIYLNSKIQRRRQTPKRQRQSYNQTPQPQHQHLTNTSMVRAFSMNHRSTTPTPATPPTPPQHTQPETLQGVVGRKVLEDLKNDKDWKVRSEAIEELQKRFEDYKDKPEAENLLKNLLPILMRMLGDPNFKISLASMKMVEQIFQNSSLNLDSFLPNLIQKLADSKIAIRQNVAKIIRSQFSKTHSAAWLDNLLSSLRKPNTNSNSKEQILSLLHRFYENDQIPASYSYEKVLTEICPLMEDLKTKIKIKTLDCLVIVALKSGELEVAKNIVGSSVNQVYYEMFIDKVNKELKTGRWSVEVPDKASNVFSKRNHHKVTITTTASSSKNHTTSFLKDQPQQPLNSNTVSMQLITRRKYSSSGHDLPRKTTTTNNQRPLSIMTRRTDQSKQQNLSEKSYGVLKSFRKKVIRNLDSSKTEYTTRDMLLPFEHSEREFKVILEQLKSEEWQVGFEALNRLRRIIENHSELIVPPYVHAIVQDILKLVESARSSLSKNAMITLNQMTNKLKRVLDSEVDFIFGKLIRKTADTNSFITQQVRKALLSLCLNCNQPKIVNLVQSHHTTKSFPVKQSIVFILETIANLTRFTDRDLPKIVAVLVDYLSEGSLEIRDRSKKVVIGLLEGVRGEEVARMLPAEQLGKIRKNKEEIQQEVVVVEAEVPQPVPSPDLRKGKSHRITHFPPEFDNLDMMLQKCQNSDWKLRVQAMKQVHSLALQYLPQMSQHKLSSKVIDLLSKQISDPNLKVASNALTIFSDLSTKLPTLIQSNLSVVTNQLFNCFGSNKQQIRSQSQSLFDCIAENIQTWMLFQHLCNGAVYGIQRARPVIIEKLINISQRVYDKKPLIYTKNIYGLLNKLLEEGRPDLQQGLQRLAESCRELVGGEVFSNTKAKIREYIS